MSFISLFFLISTALHVAVSGEPIDPSGLFLKAYQEFQNGETLERQSLPHQALEKYRYSVNILSQIQTNYSTWETLVVNYRLRKIQENIARLELLPPSFFNSQGVNSRSGSLSVPSPNLSISPPKDALPPPHQDSSMAQYRAQTLRQQLDQALQENERLNTEITKIQAEKQSAFVEIDKIKISLVEAKSQNSQIQNTEKILQINRIQQLEKTYTARLSTLQTQLNILNADNNVLSEENERIIKKLEQAAAYIRSSDDIRKNLLKDREHFYQAERIATKKLKQIKDNTLLLEELKNTHKTALTKISYISQKLINSEKTIEQAHRQIKSTEIEAKKLAEQNTSLSAQLAHSKEEVEKLQKEKILLTTKLEIELKNSSDLLTQFQSLKNKDLSSSEKENTLPATNTTPNQNNIASLNAAISIVKKSTPQSPSSSPSLPPPVTTEVTLNPNPQLSSKQPATNTISFTSEEASLAKLAETAFQEGKFADSEALYKRIIKTNPNSVSILANLGAVQSQLGKYSTAEETLRKALMINPVYPFALATLGILQLKCARINDAIETLKNSLQLDSQNFSAHNYLGIAYGETGRLEEAEKSLKTAIELNPHYATAHFNLAVLYSTQQPPNKKLARKHYLLSTHLGATPDAALERLIQ